MKFAFSFLVFALVLASCAPAQEVVALPDATSTMIVLPEATVTTTIVISPSSTPAPTKIPCDPLVADYCITDGHFILERPINPSANDSVDKSYRFASTENGTREPHHGVEFLNKYGTPVHAAADGVVIFAGPDVKAVYSPWVNFYGNVIVIRHANDLFTLYAHLSKIDVSAGEAVQVGEQIGEVGQTGVATGSHLHFEVRRGDVENYFSAQNPELWFAPKNNNGTLMLSIEDGSGNHRFAELTIARYLGGADKPEKTLYLDTYVNEMAKGAENAAMGDLKVGRYRIALKLNGQLYERWVEVQSDKLTQVVIVVK
ncbi:MAG: M23 family metallopeptidase [Chloroflexota bacterium]